MTDPEVSATGLGYFHALPAELIEAILSYLPAHDLNSVSATCRALYDHATSDAIWKRLIQASVPGAKLISSSPCPNFRALFAAHDPRWFLTRHKIWFSDRDLRGRIIVVRYDPRRNCIEGYQLLATTPPTTHQSLLMDNQPVAIHSFEPTVKLHLDLPVLQLNPNPPDIFLELQQWQDSAVARIPLRGASPTDPSSSLDVDTSPATASKNDAAARSRRISVKSEIPMALNGEETRPAPRASFMLARPLLPEEVAALDTHKFPYDDIWPPPAVPAPHRVGKATLPGADLTTFLGAPASPMRSSEISEWAFRIRSWLVMRDGAGFEGEIDRITSQILRSLRQQYQEAAEFEMRMGEEISTYSTLDPVLYTPTPEKPYRGIWVGDYSGHGCEFLLINQPDVAGDAFDPESIEQRDDETEEEFRRRKYDETVYRGRLEAIKLTGDPNVPRGEYTFVVEDLGTSGFITVAEDPPFRGARIVKSKGHVAGAGFVSGKLTPASPFAASFRFDLIHILVQICTLTLSSFSSPTIAWHSTGSTLATSVISRGLISTTSSSPVKPTQLTAVPYFSLVPIRL